MYIQIAIHHPKTGKEELLIASMHRYGAAVRTQPGIREVYTLQDAEEGVLVGLAIWKSEEALEAARPALREAIKDDDFEDWEEREIEGYRLEEV